MSEVKRIGAIWNDICESIQLRESSDGEFVKYEDYAELKAERDALAVENVALKSAISYVSDTDNQPDYQYDGMGCGIEDRGIIDRYEAARYGWDEALERMYSEVIPFASDIETPTTDAYLNSVRADGVDMAVNELKELVQRSESEAPIAAEYNHGAALYLMLFANQLRAGEPS